MFAGVQYTRLKKNLQSDIYNSFNNGLQEISQNRAQQSLIHAFAARTDIERQFKGDIKLELGASYTYAFADGATGIDTYQPVMISCMLHLVTGKIIMLFIRRFQEKIKTVAWSGGMRMETIDIESNYHDNTNAATKLTNNSKYFPKANVRVPIDSSSSIIINYAKTISRPDYTNANQVSVYINPILNGPII